MKNRYGTVLLFCLRQGSRSGAGPKGGSRSLTTPEQVSAGIFKQSMKARVVVSARQAT